MQVRSTALSLGALIGLLVLYYPLKEEDFIYYYCAGKIAAGGSSPYAQQPYQACIAGVMARSNQNVSRAAGSAYPPPAVEAFRLLANFRYETAFAVWNVILLAASAALLSLFSVSPASSLLLVTWPGFLSCWAHHKLSLLLVLAWFLGLKLIEKNRNRLGGALCALLCVQPQWFAAACLYLAAQRRWAALGVSVLLALAAFLCVPPAWILEWLASAAYHSDKIIGLDNQSLFIGIFKPLSRHLVVNWRLFQLARYGTSLVLLAAGVWCAARRNVQSLGLYSLLVLLAQPYSHVSDLIWAFPMAALLLEETRSRGRWSPRRIFAAGMLINAAFLIFAGGFIPGSLNRSEFRYRQGYFAVVVAAIYGIHRMATSEEVMKRRSLSPTGRDSSS